MPRGPRDFQNNEIYHIIQRGIEDKPIFLMKMIILEAFFLYTNLTMPIL
ncbi:MAG: hypothetical protein M1127_03630 [Patescibacteria group bacterium]|nr:hypothetical protein [Patescibacteria group bacterium]